MGKGHQAEIIAAYNEYLKAFIGNDIDGINACVQFPIAYIGDGKVSMLDEAMIYGLFDFEGRDILVPLKGWPNYSPEKGHAFLKEKRDN